MNNDYSPGAVPIERGLGRSWFMQRSGGRGAAGLYARSGSGFQRYASASAAVRAFCSRRPHFQPWELGTWPL